MSWVARRVQRLADTLTAGRTDVELSALWPGVEQEVAETAAQPRPNIFDWIASREAGGRAKEDIDAQLAEERASWGNR